MTARKYRSPEHERAYAAFNSWMRRPDHEGNRAALTTAMNEHELRDRLRRLFPSLPAPVAGLQGIPVQEVTFTNPSVADATEHRSTRLEFLADANHYGA